MSFACISNGVFNFYFFIKNFLMLDYIEFISKLDLGGWGKVCLGKDEWSFICGPSCTPSPSEFSAPG